MNPNRGNHRDAPTETTQRAEPAPKRGRAGAPPRGFPPQQDTARSTDANAAATDAQRRDGDAGSAGRDPVGSREPAPLGGGAAEKASDPR